MRLAVSRAIDLQTIDALTGKGEPQSSIPSAIFTEWTTYLDEQSVVERWHSYDPEMAKRLLAEVGYPDGFDTVMRIPENASPYWLSMAEVVSKMLNEVGISATLEGVPSAEHRFTPADRGIKFAQVQDFDGDARAFLREHFAAGRNYNYSRTDVAVPELETPIAPTASSLHSYCYLRRCSTSRCQHLCTPEAAGCMVRSRSKTPLTSAGR